jgi:nucleoside-triphosphatase THEP1
LSIIGSTALVTGGAIGGVATSIQNSKNKQRASKQTQQFADAQTKGTNYSLTQPMTEDHLSFMKKAVINKYAASLNYYNLNMANQHHKINIEQQVGIMKNDFDNFQPTIQKIQDSSQPTISLLQQKYNHVITVAKQLNIDIVDAYDLYQNNAPMMRAKIYDSLIRLGYSEDKAKVIATKYQMALDKLATDANTCM